MHILGCFTLLLFLGVVLLMLAPVILLNVVRRLFGVNKKNPSDNRSRTQQETRQQNYASSSQRKQKRKGKIFNSGEGEYVDFEEVKD